MLETITGLGPTALFAAMPAAERLEVGADAASCTVYRDVATGSAPVLAGVRHYPGGAGATLLLSVPEAMTIGTRQMRPAFSTDGLSIGAIEVARTQAGGGIYLVPVDPAPGAALPRTGGIALNGLAAQPIEVDFGDVARLVQAAGECERGLLATWNIAPDGPMSVAVPPTPRAATWISVEDVPNRYLDQVNGRFTTILWTVDADGRIGECRPVVPSGNEKLDALACPTLKRKIGYRSPARDAAGNAVEAVMVRRVRWGPIE